MGIEHISTAKYINTLLPEFPSSPIQPYWYLLDDNNLWYYDTVTSGTASGTGNWVRSNKFVGMPIRIKIVTRETTVSGSGIPLNTIHLDNQALPTELLKAVRRKKVSHVESKAPFKVYPDRQGSRWLHFNMLSKTNSENGVYTFTTHLYANKRFRFGNWARDKDNNIVRFNISDEHIVAVKQNNQTGCSTLLYGYSTY